MRKCKEVNKQKYVKRVRKKKSLVVQEEKRAARGRRKIMLKDCEIDLIKAAMEFQKI